MQLSNFQFRVIILSLIIIQFSCSTYAQSNMEYGIGVGLLYSDYTESESLPNGVELGDGGYSPSVNIFIAYKAAEKIKLTTQPGFNFHRHNEPYNSNKQSSIYFHLPAGLQYNIVGDVSIMASVYYEYLVNQSLDFQDGNRSITEFADARNLLGGSLGIAYSIGKYLEIQLTANQQFNSVNSFEYTDANGIKLGDVKLRNRFLKVNLVFRG